MMKKFLLAAALLGSASAASAAPMIVYNDVVDGGSAGTLITNAADFTFLHDIIDNGYDPLSMTVKSAKIVLALSDPNNGNERVNVQVDLGGFFQVVNNVPNGPLSTSYELDNLTFNLISALQNDGKLSVTLRVVPQGSATTANVTFNSSTLNVAVAENVPEPAMLGLLGLGVLGIAAARRRKAA